MSTSTKLAAVIYEIFASDAQWLDDHVSQRVHEIDGEIRLIDENGESRFISWCSDPVHYSVGIADVSFFDRPMQVTRDMSDSELWKNLIGENITLSFEDDSNQEQSVKCDTGVVYCWTSAFEEEGEDRLFISKQMPSRSAAK